MDAAPAGLWQRRYVEHMIRDAADWRRHVEYCWINPVKHGLVGEVRDWPLSSFRRDVRRGLVPEDGPGTVAEGGSGSGKVVGVRAPILLLLADANRLVCPRATAWVSGLTENAHGYRTRKHFRSDQRSSLARRQNESTFLENSIFIQELPYRMI